MARYQPEPEFTYTDWMNETALQSISLLLAAECITQPMADQWQFIACDNIPNPLPKTLSADVWASPAHIGLRQVSIASTKDCVTLLTSLCGGPATGWKRLKKFSPKGRDNYDIRVFGHPTHGIKTVVAGHGWDVEAHVFDGDRLDLSAIKAAIAELEPLKHNGDYGTLHFNSASGCGVICLGDGGYGDEDGNITPEVEAVVSKYAVADEWEPAIKSGFFYVGGIGTIY